MTILYIVLGSIVYVAIGILFAKLCLKLYFKHNFYPFTLYFIEGDPYIRSSENERNKLIEFCIVFWLVEVLAQILFVVLIIVLMLVVLPFAIVYWIIVLLRKWLFKNS